MITCYEGKLGAGMASAASGLVSVPTSVNAGSLSPSLVLANLHAAKRDRMAEVGAFTVDKKARRLTNLRCAVGFAARAHAVSEKGHRSDVPWLVTLTYRPGVDWRPEHVSDALRLMRHWLKAQGFPVRYVWIAEIQDGKRRADGQGRDVIHYHVAYWLPVGVGCPKFDARGWWPHGMSNRKKATHATGYLMHYLKKDKDLSAMPKGARAYGVGGLDHSLRRARRWLRLPRFVQGNSSIHDNWRPAKGGGWFAPGGIHYESEFQPVHVAGVRALLRVARHPQTIEANGPFSWLVLDRIKASALTH